MIRKFLSGEHNRDHDSHGKRNYEIQRIETFSDGVFAFAVTLLIVSLEVPKSFEELITTMRGFFAFGFSFLLLIMIWSEQHRFFRRYGMDDKKILFLNGALLFLVLFYVYPLKFLATLVFQDQIYGSHISPISITEQQFPELMIVYSAGFIAIYTLFYLMYAYADHCRNELGLSALERFDCRTTMYKLLIMITIGVTALLVSFFLSSGRSGYAGFVYFLLAPVLTLFFKWRNKKKRKQFSTSAETI